MERSGNLVDPYSEGRAKERLTKTTCEPNFTCTKNCYSGSFIRNHRAHKRFVHLVQFIWRSIFWIYRLIIFCCSKKRKTHFTFLIHLLNICVTHFEIIFEPAVPSDVLFCPVPVAVCLAVPELMLYFSICLSARLSIFHFCSGVPRLLLAVFFEFTCIRC